MNKHELIFKLNDSEKIIIQATDPVDDLHCCYRAPIVFFENTTEYTILDDTISLAMRDFSRLLQKALHNKLKLHQSITKDLGYLSNEDTQEKPGLFYKKVEGYDRWIGMDYFLWGLGGDNALSAWLYNDEKGSIIFEITPDYPWMFDDSKKNPGYMSYKKWIKTYKPCVVRKISQDVAEKWLEQAEYILKKMNENMARD